MHQNRHKLELNLSYGRRILRVQNTIASQVLAGD
uniref:Uncharacterized protein n=1 Tax=Rhizophora mucronata TaxID=61149 RepID=A0A2P2P6K7_RHIMU